MLSAFVPSFSLNGGVDLFHSRPQVIVFHTVSQIDVVQDQNTVESQALWVLGFAIHHLCLQLESAGGVVQVGPRLCQPVSTPIYRQGLRVACTVGDVETDVLWPVHVSVERRVTDHTDAHPLDTLLIALTTAHSTRQTCVLRPPLPRQFPRSLPCIRELR